MPSSTDIEIAGLTLAKAALLDHRITADDPQILAWAECFTDQDIGHGEALDAVLTHYRKPNPFAIMPGDVLATIREQPLGPTSSDERINRWLLRWIDKPHARTIEAISGIPTPHWEPPTELDPTAADTWAKNRHRDWTRENRHRIADAIRGKTSPQSAIERSNGPTGV